MPSDMLHTPNNPSHVPNMHYILGPGNSSPLIIGTCFEQFALK
jgi:hypothetical protein